MSEDKKSESPRTTPSESLSTGEMPEQSVKEVQVDYRPEPPPARAGRKIHSRMPIPPVPKGEEVADDCPSPPVDID